MPWSFSVEIFDSLSEMSGRCADWHAFVLDSGVECGVFCDPAFTEVAVGFAKSDQLVLATCRWNGETVGVMPFKLSRRRYPMTLGLWKLSVSASELRLWDFEYAVRRGAHRSDLLSRAMPALGRSTHCDLVSVDNCPVGEPPAPPPWPQERARDAVARRVQRTFLLDFPPTFEAYWATLGSKTRNTLSRKVKRLEKECSGGMRFRRFSEPRDMRELSGHAERVWKKSWHAQLHSGAPPAAASLESLAGRGWVRSYVLFAKDAPLAYLIAYQYRGKFFYENLAYDPEWSNFSPGTVLNCLMLRELYERETPRVLDFGFGYNEYKEWFGNRPEDRGELLIPFTRTGRFIVRGGHLLEEMNSSGKRWAKRLWLLKKVRGVVGRKAIMARLRAKASG